MTAIEIPVPHLADDAPNDPIPLAGEPAGEEPKRRRRRRTRAEMEAQREREAQIPEQPQGPSPEDLQRCKVALGAAFNALSSLMASRRGAHWRLTEEECGTLGDTWGAAVAPYLPKIGAAVPWATAAVVTWAMVQPRLEADAKREQLKAAEGTPGSEADHASASL